LDPDVVACIASDPPATLLLPDVFGHQGVGAVGDVVAAVAPRQRVEAGRQVVAFVAEGVLSNPPMLPTQAAHGGPSQMLSLTSW
jgi:hypothetical protein